MEHNDIPNMLGRVLSGTKYGVRQTRGKFGLGSKMALIWSKQTTGLPIRVRSAQPGQKFVSEYVLDIDIEKNAPNVHKEEKKPNTTNWHGAELSVTIEGNWTSHRQYVLAYLRQLAIVTPYAALGFRYISSHAAGSAAARNQDIQLHFARRAEVMPPLPRATKYHPTAAKENQLLVKDLLSNTKEKTLSGFFNKEFTCIKSRTREPIGERIRGGIFCQHASEERFRQARRENSAAVGVGEIFGSKRRLFVARGGVQLTFRGHEGARPGLDRVVRVTRVGVWWPPFDRRGVREFRWERRETWI